jgi:hypothetical protein
MGGDPSEELEPLPYREGTSFQNAPKGSDKKGDPLKVEGQKIIPQDFEKQDGKFQIQIRPFVFLVLISETV